MDPKRFADGDDLRAELLLAGRREAAPRRSKQRALATASFAAASAMTSTAAATLLAVVKWMGVGAALGGATMLAVPTSPKAPASLETIQRLQSVITIASTSAPVPQAPATSPAPATSDESVPRSPAPRRVVAASASTPPPPSPSPALAEVRVDQTSLRPELDALDSARRALASGNARGALAELDTYAKQFPRAHFSQEATVLRIEALFKVGDRAAAVALAERFLLAHGQSPLAERVRARLGRTEP